MTYKVEISPTALADIEQIFLWMQEYSVDTAHRWVRGCYKMMLTLEKFPNRCPISPESEYMGIEVRQLLYKQQFRILFTVSETSEDEYEELDDYLSLVNRMIRNSSLTQNQSEL